MADSPATSDPSSNGTLPSGPEPESCLFGDNQVAIYIPSRYADGALIPCDLVDQAESFVRGRFGTLFGGATGGRLKVQKGFTGTYEHEGDGRIVDEGIRRVFSAVPSESLAAVQIRKETFRVASKVAGDLSQECVAVEWGDEMHGVWAIDAQKPKRLPFCQHPLKLQMDMTLIAIRRIQSVADIPTMMSLDRWGCLEEPVELAECPKVRKAAERGKQAIYLSSEPLRAPGRLSLEKQLNNGDLVFVQGNDFLAVWMMGGNRLRGGRTLATVGVDGKITRSTFMLALSLLNASDADPLSEVIDREAVTHRFYSEYKKLFARVRDHLVADGVEKGLAAEHAQDLLGRIMFLCFLEAKGGLAQNRRFLRDGLTSAGSQFYRSFLEPLFFEVLDTPLARRKKTDKNQDIPYLNGGLFRPREVGRLSFPDEFFDPTDPTSILGVFQRFQFTLSEEADTSQEVAIDPSMFGLVLESLCAAKDKKGKGVHYTPETIAGALAYTSITDRLAELTNIDAEKIRALVAGDRDAMRPQDAQALSERIHELRILDPCVGSGSLLLAALDALMRIKTACAESIGGGLKRGGWLWSKASRRFVRESLYGVDIDMRAVEVAKLRLWLAIAIGEDEHAPLPDLGYNLRVGDSLAAVEPAAEDLHQRELEMDPVAVARNAFLDCLHEYNHADPQDMCALGDQLDVAEREFVITLLEEEGGKDNRRQVKRIRGGGPVPFLWHVHFAEVLARPNHGFDVVIANPPYVAAHQVDHESQPIADEQKGRFEALKGKTGGRDLYIPFVEQGLNLAGEVGRLAYIMPNFSRGATAKALRDLLAGRGALREWVDFGDLQVFPTATNYVALLFASARIDKRHKVFESRTITSLDVVRAAGKPEDLFRQTLPGRFRHGEIWRVIPDAIRPHVERLELDTVPLGELCAVGLGVQTSADNVYIFTEFSEGDDGLIQVYSRQLDRNATIETQALKALVKGSKGMGRYVIRNPYRVLWPYSPAADLLTRKQLQADCPKAWEYLCDCEFVLRQRESGKFDRDADWWRFRRPYGTDTASLEKILVPALMKGGMAYYDRAGEIVTTASGKGGGGGRTIIKTDDRVSYPWLLAVLNSRVLWEWLKIEADPKQGGWRGIDQSVLERIPIPLPSPDQRREVDALLATCTSPEEPPAADAVARIETVVAAAYGVSGEAFANALGGGQ
jgi:adenine-specific DNA-methyltransferase